MNILILTGKFGFGHNSAAASIKEKILLENPTYNVKIIDFIEYMFPILNKYIYGIFNFLVDKCHALYNCLNKISSKKANAPLKKVIVKKIDDLIYENNTDLIISVFPACSQYISAYKRMVNNDIILNTCITDIDVNEEWISNETNMYFVASNKTKEILLKKGVSENKIVVSGIPVKSSFKPNHRLNKKKNILIMGGGLGLIPNINELLDNIENNPSIQVNIIVGNNQKLKEELSSKYKKINIIGFTNQVSSYMKKADLIVTKAGGITMFEAIHSETPLFVIKPFLTQEVGNAEFIDSNNIGKVIWNKKVSITKEILTLLNNEIELKTMSNQMKNLKAQLVDIPYTTIPERKEESKCCI